MKPWWYNPTAEHHFELEDVCLEWYPRPPTVWRGWLIIADRYLPDGTRKYLIRGEAPDGLMINNAHGIGEKSTNEQKQ